MPAKEQEGYRYQRRPYHGDDNMEQLRLALIDQLKLEREQSRPGSGSFRPGQGPSNLAINEFAASIPLTREQQREQDVLDEMDRRYFQSREDRRGMDSQLEAQKAGATARQFAMRRGVEEDPSMLAGSPDPSQMRTIRRFSESAKPVDPDAAMTASQRAAQDPRVLAASITATGRIAAEEAKAGAKTAAEKAKADAEAAKAGASDASANDTRSEIVRLANELKDDPNLRWNVGPMDVWIPTMRGKSEAFQKKVDRLRNLLALEARDKLKGQGAVSDFEGRMLSSSQSTLDRAQDEGSFTTELERIIGEQQKKGIGGGAAEFDFVPGKGLVPRGGRK